MRLSALIMGAALAISSSAFAAPNAIIRTNLGEIKLELNQKAAPKTVENFVQYAEKGFYNQTVFHRVIDGFMIQGGGYTSDLLEKPTEKAISNEADNGLKNTIGTIAMARTSDPHSATSQFFINVADNENLDFRSKTREGYGYTVFGKVTSGMDVVNKIAKVRTKRRWMHESVPVSPVVIESVKIIK